MSTSNLLEVTFKHTIGAYTYSKHRNGSWSVRPVMSGMPPPRDCEIEADMPTLRALESAQRQSPTA